MEEEIILILFSHNPNIGAFNLWAPTNTNRNIGMSETADE